MNRSARIVEADLAKPEHQRDVVAMTDAYALDVMGKVQENNRHARRVYEAAGFAQAVYGETAGGALFYTKPL